MPSTPATTTLSTKGQVILPKEVRDLLDWEPGTRLTVVQTADGVLLRRQSMAFPPTRDEDVFGCLRRGLEAKSIEEMDAGIAAEVRRRRESGRY